ncbi:MAG: methyltransferase domain-containing protein [Chloroflexi bacterium]|nr:methyltransferase domain-containing protein [Chloroflexota bacterium]
MRTPFFLSLRLKRSNPMIHPHSDPLPSMERGIEGDCLVVLLRRTPRNDSRHSQFDLEWDDKDVVPEVVNPDVNFLFQRMNEVVLEKAAPIQGEMIVDIGCGRGIDGVELAKRGAVVIGLEPSSVMIAHAKNHISENGAGMSVVRGVGEHLPFQAQSLDKVVCKGALDHFPEPAMVISQIGMALKPEGKAIVAIANFESLGFKLGRMVWWFRKRLGFKPLEGRMPWEVPEDHTYKFDYSLISRLVRSYLKVEQVIGISLLFGLPWWGILLAKCPRKISLAILNSLDRVARYLPSFSDVIVLRCRPK